MKRVATLTVMSIAFHFAVVFMVESTEKRDDEIYAKFVKVSMMPGNTIKELEKRAAEKVILGHEKSIDKNKRQMILNSAFNDIESAISMIPYDRHEFTNPKYSSLKVWLHYVRGNTLSTDQLESILAIGEARKWGYFLMARVADCLGGEYRWQARLNGGENNKELCRRNGKKSGQYYEKAFKLRCYNDRSLIALLDLNNAAEIYAATLNVFEAIRCANEMLKVSVDTDWSKWYRPYAAESAHRILGNVMGTLGNVAGERKHKQAYLDAGGTLADYKLDVFISDN